MSHQDIEYIIDAIFIIVMILFVSSVLFMLAVATREPREKTMEPQTVTELRWYLARINTAYTQALDECRKAGTTRLQAILDREQAERELEAHATKETKNNLKNMKEKLKQATETYHTADAAVMTLYKQKIHLETELEHIQAEKE